MLGLFALSGFAGLIYESIWTHYLKLFLGHAAYAQTLVLAIFMGGMALGAWFAGDLARRLRRPLLAYVVAEILLGVLGLLFDPVFRGMQAWAFDQVLPALGSPLAIDLFKWSVSALLILPQCVLLGATFPLMSSGVIRLNPQAPGRVLAWLYFTNSLGAAAGVLVSGFVLIALVGLPGTLLTAALLNFLVALGVWLLCRKHSEAQAFAVQVLPTRPPRPLSRGLLAAAFITGAASFLYEIGWIRMLSLVLGSATHAFELMLSAFILGLAAGSFYQRNRIEAYRNPLWVLGWVQVLMAASALLTLGLYGESFDWMGAALSALQRNDAGYVLFNLFSHGLCLVLMLPATFFAGMTLPLITAVLFRAGGGDAAIGRVYAANTLGAIAGVVVAVHWVMPQFGLRQVVVFGAALDLGLGLWLLRTAGGTWPAPARLGLAGALLVSAAVISFVHFDASRLASGVFRSGSARNENEILFHRDGKTASVDVFRGEQGGLYIATNGKVDAALMANEATSDDYTMILMGVLPLMLRPDAREAAVIGFGSGRSTHALLQYAPLTGVDTIEIEPAMVEGARYFGDLVNSAFSDPRSQIHIEDAKSFFARNARTYDLIISEPSNPWVSGIASLFSQEFYARVQRHLSPGGIFLQWLQSYEINPPLVGSVLNALGREFSDYRVYGSYDADFLIVAVAQGSVPPLNAQALADPALAALAAHIGIRSPDDVETLRLGSKATLAPYFAMVGAPANSDYFPVLDQGAVRQRYLRATAGALLTLPPYSARTEGVPVAAQPLSAGRGFTPAKLAFAAQRMDSFLRGVTLEQGVEDSTGMLAQAAALTAALEQCNPAVLLDEWSRSLRSFARDYLPFLSPAATKRLVHMLRGSHCFRKLAPSTHQWVEFVEAAGLSRWTDVQRLGTALLAGKIDDPAVVELLACQILLADLMTSGPVLARQRLEGWGDPIDSEPFRYLRALALYGSP